MHKHHLSPAAVCLVALLTLPAVNAAGVSTSSASTIRTPRVCLLYTATSNASLPGPTLQSTLYVRQALDVDEVSVTVSMSHFLLGAVQVSLIANSSAAESPSVVTLKSLGPGGTTEQLDNVTFADSATEQLPLHPVNGSVLPGLYRPAEPLSALGQGRSPYAGAGGSVGTWSLLLNDTWPEPDKRVITLLSWSLKLCGTRMRSVDPVAAGAVPPGYVNTTTTTAAKDQAQSFVGGRATSSDDEEDGPWSRSRVAQWLRAYKDRVLGPLDLTLDEIKNSTELETSYKQQLLEKVAALRASLAGLPGNFNITTDTASEKSRIKELAGAIKLCHNDWYRCYLKYKRDARLQFPVAQLDTVISQNFQQRIQASKQKFMQAEQQIKEGVANLMANYPKLAKRVGAAKDLSSILSKAITSELYGATYENAVIAYIGAFLDAELGFLLYLTRFQFALNPRAAIYRTVVVLQGVLSTIFFGLSNVPLFPGLTTFGQNIPVLVNTAIRTSGAFRDGLNMVDESMVNNTQALLERRDYVVSGLAQSLKQTTDSFEKQLAQSAPQLAQLFGSLSQTVQNVADAGGVVRQELMQAVEARAQTRSGLRDQTREALGTLTRITLDVVNTTSISLDEARSLIDNLVPGQSPEDILTRTRSRVNERFRSAQQDIERLLPLADVQQLVEVLNGTVDGMLAQVTEAAKELQGQLPGPAFYTVMNATQERLQEARATVDGLFSTFETNYPGPLLNATMASINTRTRAVVQDVQGVFDQARTAFPALDPDVVFRQLNNSLDYWWTQITDPFITLPALVPEPLRGNMTQELLDSVTPLAVSVSEALGKAGSDLSTMVVPSLRASDTGVVQDTVAGLNTLVQNVNSQLALLTQAYNSSGLASRVDSGSDGFRSSVNGTETDAARPGGAPGNGTDTDLPQRMGILSEQVSQALQSLVTDAPVQSTILIQINKSLQEVQFALESRASNDPVTSFNAAVQRLVQSANESTQAWQTAVQYMDRLGAVVQWLPDQVRQDVTQMRSDLRSRLGEYNQRVTDFTLKWANNTGSFRAAQTAQAFTSFGDILSRGQVVAGALAQRLEEGSQRLTLRLSNLVPTNDTLQAVRERMASVLGVPLDDLQSAIYNTSMRVAELRSGPVTRTVHTTAGLAKRALDRLNARLQPVIQTLVARTTGQPTPTGFRSASTADNSSSADDVKPVPLLLLINSTLHRAVESAVSDWQQLFNYSTDATTNSTDGQPPLLQWRASADKGGIESEGATDLGQGGWSVGSLRSGGSSELVSLLSSWRVLADQALQRIQEGLSPMLETLTSAQFNTTPAAADTAGLSSAIADVRQAGQQMRAVQDALRQTFNYRLPLLGAGAMLPGAQQQLLSQLRSARDQLSTASVGGIFTPGLVELNRILQSIKKVADDYNSVQIQSPVDLLQFGLTQLSDAQAQARDALGQAPGALRTLDSLAARARQVMTRLVNMADGLQQ